MSSPGTTKKPTIPAGMPSNRALRRAEAERRARQRRLLFLGGALAVAVVVAVGLILLNRDSGSTPSLPAVAAAEPIDASIPQNGTVLGDPNAPVTLVEYADFQCPYCGQFFKTIEPSLIADYIKTGKVKLEFRTLAFLDDQVSAYGESDMAAEAAACAADQGKFWLFHDTLYANQHGENEGAFTAPRLREIAQAVGLDLNAFNACFDAQTHKTDLAAIQTEATQAGVNSTPTLLVNGTVVENPLDYASVKQAIDVALAS